MFYQLLVFISAFAITFSKTPSVLIIGAGPSGIAAATKLLKNGITNITILEAESRIGGRIYSVPMEGGYVDIGAEFCHGQENNVVYETVKDLNQLQHSFPDSEILYYSNGIKIESKLAEDILTLIEDYDGVIDTTNSDLNLGDSFLQVYNTTLIEKYKNEKEKLKVVTDAIQFAEHLILMHEGSFSWNRPSAGRHFQNCKGDLNMQWKTGGYHTILTVLIKNIPTTENKLPIIFNKQVSKISWGGKRAQVKTTDRSVYTADHVIFTPSIGVLKHTITLFDPVLPKQKLEAIDSIGLDAVIKIILHFPQKWWNRSTFLLLWSSEDIANSAREFPHGYSKDGVSWVTNVCGLSQAVNPNVLIAWVSGTWIPEIEQIPEDIVKDGVTFILKKFLGKDYNVTEPDKIIRSQWYSNPHFLGTYSFEKSGHFDKNISRQAFLAEPLFNDDGEPIVQFAGEATNPIYYSTVHGAIETGWREADRIINLRKQ